uniref:Hexosyltransferase n=1 Tax=Caenorhabditis japonica TaxID=281687 RepID=A0A8R1I3M1_CAEJA
MLVSRRVPVLAYLFLASVIALMAFKFHLSVLPVDDDDPTPFDFAMNFPLKPVVGVVDDELKSNDPLILVLVTTTASEWKMREQVRQSWANYSSKAVRVEFLMGIPVSFGSE